VRFRQHRPIAPFERRRLGLVAVALALASSACGTSGDSPAATGDLGGGGTETTETTGTTGTTETTGSDETDPDGRLGRIVSISPTATEILFAIGAGDQVVAVDSFSYFPPEAPVTDLSAFEPNLEAIAAFDPDLVVLSYDPGDIVSGLETAGIEVLLQPPAADLDEVYAQIADLGMATGQIDGAADLVAGMRADIAELVAAAPDSDEPLRIYHEIDETFYSASSASFIGGLYRLLGVENIADDADTDGFGFPQLSPEYILEADPQLIIIPDQVSYTAADVAERPGWGVLSAVQNDAIVVADADIASRWGPRIVEFLEFIGEAVASATIDA
jgi:iron complex transport system substrate-binding protein